jgi:hypothetical protein
VVVLVGLMAFSPVGVEGFMYENLKEVADGNTCW